VDTALRQRPFRKKTLAQASAAVAMIAASFSMATSAFAEAAPYHSARAQYRPALQAMFDGYRQTHADLAKGYFQKIAKRSLDIMVAEGCDRLREVGEFALADQFQNEWKTQISVSMNGNLTALELGDFDPISPWLDHFYDTLYRKTRGMVKGIRVIHDIYLMNYALAVVFKPNGDWRTHTAYDRIEYRKHFIPFANTATYWMSLKACEIYLPKQKKLCNRGAGILEHVMGRYVAPHMSDSFFALANHHQSGADVSVMPDQPTDGMTYSSFEDQTFQSADLQSANDEMSEE
jgi:hypothetical protein